MQFSSILRAVVILVMLSVPCASGQSQTESQSGKSWEALQRVEKFDRAYEVAVRQANADKKSWWWAMNAAKSAGSLGDGAEAGRWLAECAKRHYSGIWTVEHAAEFEGVREDAEFLVGVEAVRELAQARFERFKEEALGYEPRVIEPEGGVGEDEEVLVVIVLHGTGGRGDPIAESLAGSLAEADERCVVVGPDALRPAGGGGYSWVFVDEAAWFVERLIDRYTELYSVGRDRVVLVGFSQGANILLSLVQGKPGLMSEIAGVVVVSGHIEKDMLVYLQSGGADGEGSARVYLLIGARDPWVRTYRQGVKAFEEAGFEVELRVLGGRGHVFPSGSAGEREFGAALRFVMNEERGP